MKALTKHKLLLAWAWCDYRDKSTEYMLEYMQDYAGVDLDCVTEFLLDFNEEKRTQWYKDNPDWINLFKRSNKVEKEKENVIELSPDQILELKDTYNKAVKDNLEEFDFQGHRFLTKYCKYLLEHLDNQTNKT